MSFRIDDILRKEKSSLDNEEKNEENERVSSTMTDKHYSLEEHNHHKSCGATCESAYGNLWNQYYTSLPLYSGPTDILRDNFLNSHQVGPCCASRSTCIAENSNLYPSTYLYHVKTYPSPTYSPALPFNFPTYNHYSKRRNQVRFSPSQTKALESKFSWQKYLSPEDRKVLAQSLKLSDRQVKTWFQNRRAKWRRNVPTPGSNAKSTINT